MASVEQDVAKVYAADVAGGLRQLADMVEANPDLESDWWTLEAINHPVGTVAALNAFIKAGLASGATVEEKQSTYVGVVISWGPVGLHVYVYEPSEETVTAHELVGAS